MNLAVDEPPAGPAPRARIRVAQRLGLIAAAGELATALELVPWQLGEAREAAAWALTQWIEGRGGMAMAMGGVPEPYLDAWARPRQKGQH
jgi:hypothetical protein